VNWKLFIFLLTLTAPVAFLAWRTDTLMKKLNECKKITNYQETLK